MIEARVINGSDNIGSVIQLKYDGITIGREKINNTQILSVELVAEENVLRTEDGRKSVAGALGWGAAGGLAFGPIGGLAGLVFGGRKPQKSTTETNICFALYLKDDRKYLISSDLYTFQSIKGMCFAPVQKNVTQPDEVYKICPNCSKSIKWEDKFCSYCGETYHKPQFLELRGGMTHPIVSNKNFRTANYKRPISIVLVVLLGAAFLITLLSLIGANLTLLAIIIFFPIFIIITFSLIFINLRENKNRTVSFLISTCLLIAILTVSSIGFSNMESIKNITKAIPQNSNLNATTYDSNTTNEIVIANSTPYEEIGIKGLTVYIYTDLEELSDLKIIADIYKNELLKDKSVFQIFFFNTKANAEHALNSSTLNYQDLVALIARYNFNSNTGVDEIYYDIEEKVFEELPSIKLEIYEGPLYTEDGTICYYRIKVSVVGLPTPIVKFSKDDSLGNLGKNIVQINLFDKNESYTLTATATNSIGKASDSINLTWIEK